MAFVAFIVVAGTAAAAGLWFGTHLSRRLGVKTEMSPARRGRYLVVLGIMLGLGLVAAWAITTGNAALGIGILVAIYVVPNLVMIPFRITQANRRAKKARSCREGSA